MSSEDALVKSHPQRMLDLIVAMARWRPQRGLATLALTLTLASAMTTGYLWTQREVTIVLNDRPLSFRTHQTSAGAVLEEAGIELHEEDIVLPGPDAPTQAGDTIVVRQATPVAIEVDGQVIELRTHSCALDALLREAAITLKPHDQISVNGDALSLTHLLAVPGEIAPYPRTSEQMRHRINASASSKEGLNALLLPPAKAGSLRESASGQKVGLETPFVKNPSPTRSLSSRGGRHTANPGGNPGLRIVIRRAVPIHVDDDGVPTTIYSTASTVGEALRGEGITLYLADKVSPDLSARVSRGVHVYIRRSKPVEILVDGRTIKTRTQGEMVAQVLGQEGVALMGKDYTRPGGDAAVADDMAVQVVRVKEETLIEGEPIPFETVWKADDGLEIDQQHLDQAGKEGVKKRRTKIVYENGQEVRRTMEEEWVDREPTARIIAYGTKIVVRETETPEGPIHYWRKIRVLATSYTAATSGKSRDHPHYGITALGWEAGKGIVAVDPRVINLRTKMYVPGYGMCVAGDTGGKVKGRRIDLGYDESDLKLWYRWVDVYLLAPPPPRDRIRWILPG